MQRSILFYFLQRISEGDRSVLPKACSQLADRLVYIPVTSCSEPEGSGRTVKVDVLKIPRGKKTLVPLFTSEKRYRSWAAASGHETESISLLGGDFCAALNGKCHVLVDPGDEHALELTPDEVKLVAAAPVEAAEDSPAEAHAAPVQQPEPAAAAEPAEPVLDRNAPRRSQPTQIVQRQIPGLLSAESRPTELPPPRTYVAEERPARDQGSLSIQEQIRRAKREKFPELQRTDVPASRSTESGEARVANTPAQANSGDFARTVIFSPDNDSNRVIRDKEDDPKKKRKRSFLNFLKQS